MTNFHLPKSTLFMLVCAFSGTALMKKAYAHAVAEGFRFYSYGDACLLHRAESEIAVTASFSFKLSSQRRRRAAGRNHNAARHDPHARLHAGRHRRDGEGRFP